MRITRIWGIVAIGLTALAIGGCGSSDDDSGGGGGASSGDGGDKTVKIGFSGALSGPYAAYDVPLLNGMDFAAKEINAKGGIDGYKVEIVSKDNKGDQAADRHRPPRSCWTTGSSSSS